MLTKILASAMCDSCVPSLGSPTRSSGAKPARATALDKPSYGALVIRNPSVKHLGVGDRKMAWVSAVVQSSFK